MQHVARAVGLGSWLWSRRAQRAAAEWCRHVWRNVGLRHCVAASLCVVCCVLLVCVQCVCARWALDTADYPLGSK